MTIKRAFLALGCLLGAATPAAASDLGRDGGLKGTYGVPVPAPVPVYESFRWYVRADLGLGTATEPAIKEQGMIYGSQDSIAPFGMSPSWFSSDFETSVIGALGAGLYITPRVRGDVTFDFRTKGDVHGAGSYIYDEYVLQPPPPTATGNTIRGTTVDHTQVRGTVGLVNLYYDLMDRGGFTPYIGIGAGFAVRHFDRRHSTTEEVYDNAGLATGQIRTYEGHGHANAIAPAASAVAGASYALSPGMLIDLNYRYTYFGSASVNMDMSGTPTPMRSRLTVGDTHEHSVRAGLRWNVW
jgi:opacity protein-like surface antigen